MIKIVQWWETFENATSRKLAKCNYFHSPAGTDSKGYRTLMRKGAEGVAALGVFQGLCQVMAMLTKAAREAGEMRNSDGSEMDIVDLLDLTRLPEDVLLSAIELLVDVGWVEKLEPAASQSSPSDIPSSPSDIPSPPSDIPSPPNGGLPVASQDTPSGEDRIGGDRIGGEETVVSCPTKPDALAEPMLSLWKQAPEKSRRRSSQVKVNRAWKAVRASERPSRDELLHAIGCWKQSEDWQKDGGQFAMALDRWIRERQWQNCPDLEIPPQNSTPDLGGRSMAVTKACDLDPGKLNPDPDDEIPI